MEPQLVMTENHDKNALYAEPNWNPSKPPPQATAWLIRMCAIAIGSSRQVWVKADNVIHTTLYLREETLQVYPKRLLTTSECN